MCLGPSRVLEHSCTNYVFPISSAIFMVCLYPYFDLDAISLSPVHSFLTPLLTFLPLSSLPISPAGCLSVSETKQTESCVSGPVTPRSWETGSSQTSAAASSFVGHVRHSPDISWRLLGPSLCAELTLCPGGREASKAGHIFRCSWAVETHIMHESGGCTVSGADWNQAYCNVWNI